MSCVKNVNNHDDVMDILYSNRDMSDLGEISMKPKRAVNTASNYEPTPVEYHSPSVFSKIRQCVALSLEDTIEQIPVIMRISHGFLTIFGMLSLCYFGTAIFAPDKLLSGSLDYLSDIRDETGVILVSAEEHRLIMKDIGIKCFNKLPFSNDKQMCATVDNILVNRVGNLDRQIDVYKTMAAQESNKALEAAKNELNSKFPNIEEKPPVNPTKG
jgi:hypothetical protein